MGGGWGGGEGGRKLDINHDGLGVELYVLTWKSKFYAWLSQFR